MFAQRLNLLKSCYRTLVCTTRLRPYIAIKKAFDENDIMIPFPIRTLDFGIKGGEKLAEALPQGVLAGLDSKSN